MEFAVGLEVLKANDILFPKSVFQRNYHYKQNDSSNLIIAGMNIRNSIRREPQQLPNSSVFYTCDKMTGFVCAVFFLSSILTIVSYNCLDALTDASV